jgi:leucyl aminopeptidase
VSVADGFEKASELEALLVVAPEAPEKALFEGLPESKRWQLLHARFKARGGTLRTSALSNQAQTLAVLGYMRPDASAFERLSLAGRMLKEASARNPRSIGLVALGDPASAEAALDALLAAALAHAFALPNYRASLDEEHPLEQITVLGGRKIDTRYAIAAARGNNLARWLTALPPNILDAGGYHKAIAELARRHGLLMRWLDEAALRRAGANAFLAVAAANDQRTAGIAHLRYRPGAKSAAADLALVGKGILFDTGGVNLKPHRSMLDMHTDMAGSAVALATLIALSELSAPISADAWLAITDNRIGPNAYRPQEVVRAANGTTIQVIHTDAEGRMVLADTLALAARTRPRLMIDFATLTGACVYSLTERMSGVFTNRPELAPKLFEAGQLSGERVWNFPFDSDYDADLESKVADVLQCAVDGKGDHILAARFLGRFVPDELPWVHVDLSSSSRGGGLAHINTDITGFGVRYALELILRQSIL